MYSPLQTHGLFKSLQLELGSRNHDVVPVQLVASISGLGKSVVIKILKELVRNKLISYETSMCMLVLACQCSMGDNMCRTLHGPTPLGLLSVVGTGVSCNVGIWFTCGETGVQVLPNPWWVVHTATTLLIEICILLYA